jgi:cytochrome c oxidase subunit 3
VLLGTFFVLFQGAEWVALVRQGLTITSSTLGSFFYLIVGMHALHAVAALGLLAHTWLRLRKGWLVQSQLAAAQVFWYFVVGLWPILYLVVYLAIASRQRASRVIARPCCWRLARARPARSAPSRRWHPART